jgi:hypothetical protein
MTTLHRREPLVEGLGRVRLGPGGDYRTISVAVRQSGVSASMPQAAPATVLARADISSGSDTAAGANAAARSATAAPNGYRRELQM